MTFTPPMCMTIGPRGSFAMGQLAEDWALEAWERQKFAGVTARYCDIVPNHVYCNVGGRQTSYPLPRS